MTAAIILLFIAFALGLLAGAAIGVLIERRREQRATERLAHLFRGHVPPRSLPPERVT